MSSALSGESLRTTAELPSAEALPRSSEASAHAGPETIRTKPPSRTRAIMLTLALLVGLGGGGYWYANKAIESTDNAQVDADVIAVPTRTAGTVARVHFVENQAVQAGALLVELDDATFRAKLQQADAALAVAEAQAQAADADAEVAATHAVGNRAIARANLTTNSVGARASSDDIRQGEALVQTAQARFQQASLELNRAQGLVAAGAMTRAQLDNAQTAHQIAASTLAAESARLSTLRLERSKAQSRVVEASANVKLNDNVDTLVRQAKARAAAAHAQVETARAAQNLAALELSYTKIVAPHDGVVSKKSINVGQTVANGQAVVQLVPPERWITANFKETQIAAMQTGQPVHFTVDAYPGIEFEGDIESFSGATGARFTLLPPDNATGNFTKVVQRVPVRVRVHELPKSVELRPGMSVELSVDTSRG